MTQFAEQNRALEEIADEAEPKRPRPPREPTSLYCAVMLALERRRLQLGVTMAQLNDLAGSPDGYYAKALYAEKPSGRQAQWDSLQVFVEALFYNGFSLHIEPSGDGMLASAGMRRKIAAEVRYFDRKTRREFYQTICTAGGHARAKKLTSRKRQAVARKAARARWRREKAKQNGGDNGQS